MNLNVSQRKKLNKIPALIKLNSKLLSFDEYVLLYRKLLNDASSLGFDIQPVNYAQTDMQSERRKHDLLYQNDFVENCFFVVSIYTHLTDKIEFVGYFS